MESRYFSSGKKEEEPLLSEGESEFHDQEEVELSLNNTMLEDLSEDYAQEQLEELMDEIDQHQAEDAQVNKESEKSAQEDSNLTQSQAEEPQGQDTQDVNPTSESPTSFGEEDKQKKDAIEISSTERKEVKERRPQRRLEAAQITKTWSDKDVKAEYENHNYVRAANKLHGQQTIYEKQACSLHTSIEIALKNFASKRLDERTESDKPGLEQLRTDLTTAEASVKEARARYDGATVTPFEKIRRNAQKKVSAAQSSRGEKLKKSVARFGHNSKVVLSHPLAAPYYGIKKAIARSNVSNELKTAHQNYVSAIVRLKQQINKTSSALTTVYKAPVSLASSRAKVPPSYSFLNFNPDHNRATEEQTRRMLEKAKQQYEDANKTQRP